MTESETFLVTGALGCIGAWTCVELVREGTPVVAFDLGENRHRLELIARPGELERIDFVRGDVTDLTEVEGVLADHRITHVVHLAALQVPFCRADPVLGARVNVVGTVNVFEATKRHGLPSTVAYASSAAVYNSRGELAPETIYGVYKLANEGTGRVYWQDHGVASIGLRPHTVYGPARDQGLTAAPTLAIEAALRGEPYRIGFGGRTQLHYAPDAAQAFVEAARAAPEGAATYSLGGAATEISDFVALVREILPGAEITFDGNELPFPPELPRPWFDSPLTPLADGVRETIEVFRAARA